MIADSCGEVSQYHADAGMDPANEANAAIVEGGKGDGNVNHGKTSTASKQRALPR